MRPKMAQIDLVLQHSIALYHTALILTPRDQSRSLLRYLLKPQSRLSWLQGFRLELSSGIERSEADFVCSWHCISASSKTISIAPNGTLLFVRERPARPPAQSGAKDTALDGSILAGGAGRIIYLPGSRVSRISIKTFSLATVYRAS